MKVGSRVKILSCNFKKRIGKFGEIIAIHPEKEYQFPYEVKFDNKDLSNACYRKHELELFPLTK